VFKVCYQKEYIVVASFGTFTVPKQVSFSGLELENGWLDEVCLQYETYGTLNPGRTNAVLVLHAWTGSAHMAGQYTPEVQAGLTELEQAFGGGWWENIATQVFSGQFVVCANHLGSCYGSTGPLSINPATNKPYGAQFPALSVRDLAQAQVRLLDALGLDQVTVIGGSLGGMVALELALLHPERVKKLVVLAAPATHSPWARAWGYLARQAVAFPSVRPGLSGAGSPTLAKANSTSTTKAKSSHAALINILLSRSPTPWTPTTFCATPA
jgi:homoserine O-acetyltransferase/O-succinyltransferase